MLLDRIRSSLAFRLAANKRKIARGIARVGKAARSNEESKYSRFLREVEACSGKLEGKRVLEIGSDSEGILLRMCVERGKVVSAVGVNPAITTDEISGPVQLLGLDAARLPFPEASFDIAVSLSVFEHVFDLPAVLAECHRVLKPGGVLVAEFGPIWSSSWGHHLWLYHGGDIVDWRTHPLPPYAHLIMKPAELQAWCHETYHDADLTRKIVEFVHESREQNRLFFSDYEEIVRTSPFDTVFLVGDPDVPFPAGTPDVAYASTFALLKGLHPDKTGFGYHLIKTMLRRAS